MFFKTDESYKWIVLAISFLLMLSFAVTLQALPPIFDLIAKEIPISNSQAGMLMGAFSIPGIFIPFIVAYLASRFNERTIILMALSIIIIGLIAFSLAMNFYTLLIFRIIIGIGATALMVLAPLLVTKSFDQKNMGIAMGIFNISVPLGTVLASNIFGTLGTVMKWRIIMLGIALFVIGVLAVNYLVLFLAKNKDKKDSEEEAKEHTNGLWSNPELWFLAIIWALANAQSLSYTTFGIQYYQGLGQNPQNARLLTSLIMIVPIFAGTILGIIIDKTGWKKQLFFIGTSIMAVSFLLIAKVTPLVPLWAVLLGIGFTPIPILVFALLPEIVNPQQLGLGLGMLTIASNCGIVIGPPAFGLLLDRTKGNFDIGFIILAMISIGILVFLRGLKNQSRKS